MTQSELKPCPFCGDPMQIVFGLMQHKDWHETCPMRDLSWSTHDDERIEHWNTRAAQPQGEAGELADQIEALSALANPAPWQIGTQTGAPSPHVVDFGKPPEAPFAALHKGGRFAHAKAVLHTDGPVDERDASARLIALLRNNVPAILSALRDQGAGEAGKLHDAIAHLEWIASISDMFFAECSQAEEVVERAGKALLTLKALRDQGAGEAEPVGWMWDEMTPIGDVLGFDFAKEPPSDMRLKANLQPLYARPTSADDALDRAAQVADEWADERMAEYKKVPNRDGRLAAEILARVGILRSIAAAIRNLKGSAVDG